MRDKQNLPALLQVIDFQPDDHSNSIRGFHFFFFLSKLREREREREREGEGKKKSIKNEKN